MKKLELYGLRFGRLLVLEWAGSRNGKSRWLCQCDCGNKIEVSGVYLSCGDTKSCGCLNADIVSFLKKTHGMKGTRLYNIWRAMKDRCSNKNCAAYVNYGGRGIKVCDEWFNSFENFLMDMGDSYQNGLTIERKNVNGNYEKDNCEWIPKDRQSLNRRNNIFVDTEKGKLTLSEAAKIANVSWSCMYGRFLRKYPKDKMLLPIGKTGQRLNNV